MKIIQRLFDLQQLEMGSQSGSPETRQLISAIRKEVPEPILGHYDRLLARGKKGVALVRKGVCSGCQMRLASGSYATLLRDDDIATCDTCGRYMLLVPESPAAEAFAPSQKPAKPRARKKKAVEVQ